MKNVEIILLLSSNNDAGIPDLERLQKKYRRARVLNLYGKSFFSKLVQIICLMPSRNKIIVHTQSDKWGLIGKILICGYHIQIAHVQKDFIFTKNLRFLHRILYYLNRTFSKKLFFLSQNVAHSFNKCGKLINFESMIKRGENHDTAPEYCFFFGRDEDYKNLDFFIEIARRCKQHKFYIFSKSYNDRKNLPINVKVNNHRLSDDEVNALFKKNGLLILPYKEVSQSGPFYLGFENGTKILVPNNEYFRTFNSVENIFLIHGFDLEVWSDRVNNILNDKSTV